MYEIKEIKIKICEHNPKAQSVCHPEKPMTFNEFHEHIRTQLKKYYDITRGIKTKN